jgi:hypothetical protein
VNNVVQFNPSGIDQTIKFSEISGQSISVPVLPEVTKLHLAGTDKNAADPAGGERSLNNSVSQASILSKQEEERRKAIEEELSVASSWQKKLTIRRSNVLKLEEVVKVSFL